MGQTDAEFQALMAGTGGVVPFGAKLSDAHAAQAKQMAYEADPRWKWAMGQLDALGASQRQTIDQQYNRAGSTANINLITRGLGNSTLRPAMQSSAARMRTDALARLDSMLAQNKSDLGLKLMAMIDAEKKAAAEENSSTWSGLTDFMFGTLLPLGATLAGGPAGGAAAQSVMGGAAGLGGYGTGGASASAPWWSPQMPSASTWYDPTSPRPASYSDIANDPSLMNLTLASMGVYGR